MAQLKTQRDVTIPSIPIDEEGIKDADRVSRWRKAHITVLKDQHEDIYDDLKSLLEGNFRLVNKTPASATASGEKGEICFDTSYVYVCIATNTWKRASISTW